MANGPYTLTDLERKGLTAAIAKTVRDFDYYFHDLSNAKLEEWIESTIEDYYQ
jgi:hypothetical protein